MKSSLSPWARWRRLLRVTAGTLASLALATVFIVSREAESLSPAGLIPKELKGQLNPPGKVGSVQVPDYPSLRQGNTLTERTWIELNKIISPAVVNISTSNIVRRMPVPRDPFFDFFQMPGGPGGAGRPPQVARSLGTGFIISEDGVIVTNNHVVDGADSITVTAQLNDGPEQKYEAKVLGRDERSDIALLKIENSKVKFPVAQLGSSKDIEVGENVAALGNPFGLGKSITRGIISAKNRPIGEINKFELLQTDALINPGNSGGPLVNIRGMVIGVNQAINAAAQGIGFAIPIDEVKSIIVQLQKYGTVKKGYLGIVPQDISPQAASYLKLRTLEGALVAYVESASPADKAGLKEGDVITEFGTKKIRTSVDLRNAAGDADTGSKMPIKIIREGKEKSLLVTMSEAPTEPRAVQPPARKAAPPSQQDKHGFGLKVGALTPEIRNQLGINSPDIKGALVTDIEPGSVAAFAGVQPGDVVFQVNSKKVNGPEDVLNRLRPGSNALTIFRAGAIISIFIGAGE